MALLLRRAAVEKVLLRQGKKSAAIEKLLRQPHLAAPIAATVKKTPQQKRFYTTRILHALSKANDIEWL